MASPLHHLQQRIHDSWLMVWDHTAAQPAPRDEVQRLGAETEKCLKALTLAARISPQGKGKGRSPEHLRIVLAESDPLKFLARWIAATSVGSTLFLGNPRWSVAEWRQVLQRVQPDLIWGTTPPVTTPVSIAPLPTEPGWILIPTGGSSGQIRFAIHTWTTLTASVRGLQASGLGPPSGQFNCFCTLPLFHVSGLMQFVRSLLTEGQWVMVPFKVLETYSFTSPSPPTWQRLDRTQFCLSLVPTQLQRLLSPERLSPEWLSDQGLSAQGLSPQSECRFERHPKAEWLAQFHTIFLGGAPAWPQLLDRSQQLKLPLALTYGLTETASQVVTLAPSAFLQGKRGCGQVLPHAQVRICDAQGRELPAGEVGQVVIAAESLALGYYGESKSNFPPAPPCFLEENHQFWTDDLGYFDPEGGFHIVGRGSDKIITGGENVFAPVVEAAIRETGLVADVVVLGLPDPEWGERVVAVYVPFGQVIETPMTETPMTETPMTETLMTEAPMTENPWENNLVHQLKQAIVPLLSPPQRPKQWISRSAIPRNSQGKVDRQHLRHWISP